MWCEGVCEGVVVWYVWCVWYEGECESVCVCVVCVRVGGKVGTK